MKKLGIVFIFIGLCFAKADTRKLPTPDDAGMTQGITRTREYFPGRTLIAAVGDMRSVMGPQSKNIAASSDGNTIAVVYGPPSDPYDANHPFDGVYVAYSTDRGASWSLYGPHNQASPLRRIYPAVDGSAHFDSEAGETFFAWQEGQLGYDPTNNFMMLDENVPASPSFSSPTMLSGDIDGWWPCIGVNPDDNANVMMTAYSYHAGDTYINYCWISDDGGYSWSDTIAIAPPAPPYNEGSGCGGHFRWGSGGYAFFTYHAEHNSAEWPHYVESTDGGYNWSAPVALPAISSTQFWWHEGECEVIDDLPFAAHNDISEGGVFHLFHPDPDDPGSPGSWNWVVTNVGAAFDGPHAYQGTTCTCTHIQYPSLSYEPDLDVILMSFKAGYEIAPPPAGWTDGNYLGGILSTDGGRNWYPTRPLSGPLLQATGGPVEAAHRLATVDDTTFVYSTWTDADDGIVGNQYFELGVVQTIDATIFGPGYGVEEYTESDVVGSKFTVLPSVSSGVCRALFSLSIPGVVTLTIYDAVGRTVTTPFNKQCERGDYVVDLKTSDLPNGVYLVSLESPAGRDVGKFIIQR
jgi:hypothetical protein